MFYRDTWAQINLDTIKETVNKGIQQNILVLEYISPKTLQIARDNNIATAASSLGWIQHAIKEDISGLKVHLKFDTGMNRI